MKLKLLVAGATLCALGITGCTKEADEAVSLAGKPVVMTMQSSAVELDTRADYQGNALVWRKGDKMSVVVDGVTGNENCTLTTNEEGKDAPFSGKVIGWDGSKAIYAFYPYSSTGYAVSDGNVTFTLPNPQRYTIGGAIDNSFMVGTGSATVTDGAIKATVSMKQVMSIIKLNITNAPGKVTGVKLKCAEAIFATTATVTPSTAAIASPGTWKSELSMNVTDNTDGTTKAVSLAILPANLSGKPIQVEVSFAGGTAKVINKVGIDFVRNTHYEMAFDGTPVKWAVGNLVSDGGTGAKIGNPAEYGLIFQFGSLIGWAPTTDPLAIVAKPTSFNGNTAWADEGKIWQSETEDVPFTAAGSNNEQAGIGDPCRYYLKGTWRLPTIDEFNTMKLIANSGYPKIGPWTWTGSSVTHTSGLTLPAAGIRRYSSGSSSDQGFAGYYWSSSVPSGLVNANSVYFSSALLTTGTYYRAAGYSVRCVQE